ncbi:MAG: glutamate-5-semialdehyde dehydrogenase [Bacteroidaceae bacterium]
MNGEQKTIKEQAVCLFEAAQKSSRSLARLAEDEVNSLLEALADALERETPMVLEANEFDLARMDVNDPKYDRLRLTSERLKGIADDLRNVARLSSPLDKMLFETIRPNGMQLRKVTVPFGVIGVIYEARPNVTVDVFSLCFKTRNVCVLKGSADAEASNLALVKVIQETLKREGITPEVIQLLPAERAFTAELLNARGYVDLLIPRGSSSLINYVRDQAHIPVIETGAGVCHTYFDVAGDLQKGAQIINNAKTRRVSVCNALDCLIVHRDRLCDLPILCEKLAESKVRIYADPEAAKALIGYYPSELLNPATPDSFGSEYLSYAMSIRTVANMDEALDHISRYGLKHSECIITENAKAATLFQRLVDAACVYVNVSTAFTDGAQFGLGAEIGISTQKLHARGPMGLAELCTYKWLIDGDGQIRNS